MNVSNFKNIGYFDRDKTPISKGIATVAQRSEIIRTDSDFSCRYVSRRRYRIHFREGGFVDVTKNEYESFNLPINESIS